MNVRCFILARNEATNIDRCLRALEHAKVPTVVLDSQSTDRTAAIARARGAEVEDYRYVNHAIALEYICRQRTDRRDAVMVLDADMVIAPALLSAGLDLLAGPADVVAAPVRMYWNGVPLRFGSLYPPKPFLFRGGQHYFKDRGHGEALLPDVRTAVTRQELIHDDRKPYAAYLSSQDRYSLNLLERAEQGQMGWADRARLSTPLLIFAVPAVSYLIKGGIFAGRAGLGYALDRLIAEAIMHRQALARGLDRNSSPSAEKADESTLKASESS
jgi:glycosyltransferase involved in cell wall biosynthesis